MRLRRTTALAWLVGAAALAGAADPPPGWILRGSAPQDYEMSMDETTPRERHATLSLRSRASSSGFGTAMKMDPAADFIGKKVRLSAVVKGEDVRGRAALWLRVDGEEKGTMLAFDNMHDRPLQGTFDWTRHEIVLPVSSQAHRIAYGLLLGGEGRTWVDGVTLEIVPDDVPVTGGPKPPANLGFEE
jgi:hypothetical protein